MPKPYRQGKEGSHKLRRLTSRGQLSDAWRLSLAPCVHPSSLPAAFSNCPFCASKSLFRCITRTKTRACVGGHLPYMCPTCALNLALHAHLHVQVGIDHLPLAPPRPHRGHQLVFGRHSLGMHPVVTAARRARVLLLVAVCALQVGLHSHRLLELRCFLLK